MVQHTLALIYIYTGEATVPAERISPSPLPSFFSTSTRRCNPQPTKTLPRDYNLDFPPHTHTSRLSLLTYLYFLFTSMDTGSSSSQGLKLGFRINGNDCNHAGSAQSFSPMLLPWASAWTCAGDEGILPTSLRLGRCSRLAFVDPPSARCNASRSAREGAKARSREGVEDAMLGVRPVGFNAS